MSNRSPKAREVRADISIKERGSTMYTHTTTISTHNGTEKAYRAHNNRTLKKKEEHIDYSRTHLNEITIDLDVREAYSKTFQKSFDEYNEKQKRKDRQITEHPHDYFMKQKGKGIGRQTKTKESYEMIVQVGHKNDDIPNELKVEILREYRDSFHKENPNCIPYGIFLHLDEETPHLHIDYIPVGTGYKRGTKVKPSLTKAMDEMGFKTYYEEREVEGEKKWLPVTGQTQWIAKENERLEKICGHYGIEIIHPMRGKKVEHLHHSRFKEEMKKLEEERKKQSEKLKEIYERIKEKESELEEREINVSTRENNADLLFKNTLERTSELDKKEEILREKEREIFKKERNAYMREEASKGHLVHAQKVISEAEEYRTRTKEYEQKFKAFFDNLESDAKQYVNKQASLYEKPKRPNAPDVTKLIKKQGSEGLER